MVVEVINGSFRYEKNTPLLENISFKVEQGKVLAVVGPNGSGKTTLLKCLLGILEWNRGATHIDGKKAYKTEHYMEIGYVPQAYNMSFPYRVGEMVLMGCNKQLSGLSVPSKADIKRADDAMKMVGIFDLDLKDRLCTKISGGQLQMVFIARALAGSPKMLVMDEPESHLDLKNQYSILRMIKRLVRENNMSFIINTHYPDHALRLADDCLIIYSGKWIHGPVRDILTAETLKTCFGVNAKPIKIKSNRGVDFDSIVVIEDLE
ncbi:MAG TPA: ABC transporter ATP-binding protein [Clostridiaceae bacterium]|jgi:iron complex transport system ATP-binding protein|nr:ABC transporter ATP-binding protein [Clostridiaceae bacterium]